MYACLQEGVSGEWRGAWLILVRRVLVYTTKDSNVCTVDLRKTRCVGKCVYTILNLQDFETKYGTTKTHDIPRAILSEADQVIMTRHKG